MKYRLKLNIVDYSTIAYLLITLLLVLFFFQKIENPMHHIFMRIGFFVILLVSIFVRESNYGKILNLLSTILPLSFLGYFYNETASFNHLFFNNFDGIISQFEFSLFNVQPSVIFSKRINELWFSEIMNYGYFSYYLLIIFVPVLFYYKKPEFFQQLLFILLTSFYLYYVVFIIIPVVGPQFYFQGDQAVFTPQGPFGYLIKFIQDTAEVPTGAFPSSHVGIALLLGYYIYKYFKEYLVSVSLVIAILILSTVYIKAHYVVDILAAFIVTPIFYYLSNKLYISVHNSNQKK